jgi:hypothetical protein
MNFDKFDAEESFKFYMLIYNKKGDKRRGFVRFLLRIMFDQAKIIRGQRAVDKKLKGFIKDFL